MDDFSSSRERKPRSSSDDFPTETGATAPGYEGKVLLAGGSGFLGAALAESFAADGRDVVILTRSPRKYAGPGRAVGWDGRTVGDWASELDGAAAVVNLAGKSVDCRFTPAARREILASRVDSVIAIAAAIVQCAHPPAVWVQAAAVGIYGDAGERVCEPSERFVVDYDIDALGGGAADFLARTCRRWEAAFDAADVPGTRKAVLRIGVVLGPGGGAWPVLSRMAKAFVGGRIGSGRQWVSWLHVADFVRIVWWCVRTPSAEGVYNAVAPTPVRNADLMAAVRSAVGRPWAPPVPKWAVRVGARVAGTEAALVLGGQRCSTPRLKAGAFEFAFPTVEAAVGALVGSGREGERPTSNVQRPTSK